MIVGQDFLRTFIAERLKERYMKPFSKLAVAAVFVGALVIVCYGGSVDLPARGVAEDGKLAN